MRALQDAPPTGLSQQQQEHMDCQVSAWTDSLTSVISSSLDRTFECMAREVETDKVWTGGVHRQRAEGRGLHPAPPARPLARPPAGKPGPMRSAPH